MPGGFHRAGCCCGGASTDCSDCAANCDGGDIAVVVSGCSDISGTMTRIGVCHWRLISGPFEIVLRCVADVWEFSITSLEVIPCRGSVNPALLCTGTHPTGSFSYLDSLGNMAYVTLS